MKHNKNNRKGNTNDGIIVLRKTKKWLSSTSLRWYGLGKQTDFRETAVLWRNFKDRHFWLRKTWVLFTDEDL